MTDEEKKLIVLGKIKSFLLDMNYVYPKISVTIENGEPLISILRMRITRLCDWKIRLKNL